jgi:hypothetical protein
MFFIINNLFEKECLVEGKKKEKQSFILPNVPGVETVSEDAGTRRSSWSPWKEDGTPA